MLIPTDFFTDPVFHMALYPFLFVLGAALGSFFNVCIYRIPAGVPLSFPGSHCYRCGAGVRWFDNLPLLSYWLLRGRCRRCGAPFSMRYFGVELLTASLFLLAYVLLGPTLTLLPALTLISLLIVATFTDIDHWIIPDRVSLGGLGAGLVLAAIPAVGNAPGNPLARSYIDYGGRFEPLLESLLGAALGFACLWLIGFIGRLVFRKDAMGWGDIKLFAMFGAFCGVESLIYILLVSSLVGTVVGLAGLVAARLETRPEPASLAPLTPDAPEARATLEKLPLGGEERTALEHIIKHPEPGQALRHHLPFGPSLAVGALAVYFFGPQISTGLFIMIDGLITLIDRVLAPLFGA